MRYKDIGLHMYVYSYVYGFQSGIDWQCTSSVFLRREFNFTNFFVMIHTVYFFLYNLFKFCLKKGKLHVNFSLSILMSETWLVVCVDSSKDKNVKESSGLSRLDKCWLHPSHSPTGFVSSAKLELLRCFFLCSSMIVFLYIYLVIIC